jgi:hypothetical protein
MNEILKCEFVSRESNESSSTLFNSEIEIEESIRGSEIKPMKSK